MTRTITAVLLGCSVFGAFAQDIKEPEFPDVFYALISGGQLKTLEREEASARTNGSVFTSIKAGLELPGAASPVRLQSGLIELVVLSPDSLKTDPGSLYHVRKLQSKKKSREVLLGKVSAFGGAKTSDESLVAYTFSKYGKSSIKLTIAALPPGEYAVGRAHGRVLFCFGVD